MRPAKPRDETAPPRFAYVITGVLGTTLWGATVLFPAPGAVGTVASLMCFAFAAFTAWATLWWWKS